MKAKKTILIVAAMLLVAALSIGGTIAYLTSTTEEVKNTFTVGNIKITLIEHEWDDENGKLTETEVPGNDYHLFPGSEYGKDPVVTVKAKSEDCRLFVKVTEPTEDVIDYELNLDGWTKLGDEDGVYYREVTTANEDQSWNLIVDDVISVADDVDAAKLATIGDDVLSFQAYAIQQQNLTTAEAAWAALFPAPASN